MVCQIISFHHNPITYSFTSFCIFPTFSSRFCLDSQFVLLCMFTRVCLIYVCVRMLIILYLQSFQCMVNL